MGLGVAGADPAAASKARIWMLRALRDGQQNDAVALHLGGVILANSNYSLVPERFCSRLENENFELTNDDAGMDISFHPWQKSPERVKLNANSSQATYSEGA